MEGVVELAEEIFHMPVRIGSPQDIKGLTDIVNNPIYATGVGLLQYGLMRQHEEGRRGRRNEVDKPSFFERIKSWFQGSL